MTSLHLKVFEQQWCVTEHKDTQCIQDLNDMLGRIASSGASRTRKTDTDHHLIIQLTQDMISEPILERLRILQQLPVEFSELK